METKIVSIIMPVFNGEQYIRYAIESVLAQTYSKWELIVVDDGSTDDTPHILHQYREAIHCIRQSNQGLSAARNTGIRNSHSEIVALLDADDVWDPRYLDVMVNLLERQPKIGAVYCGFEYINSEGQTVGRPMKKVAPPERFREVLLNHGNWLVPSAVIFRRNLADRVELFDETIGPVADTDLWIRMSKLVAFAGLPDVMVRYRCHATNMSKNPRLMINAGKRLEEKTFGPPAGDPSKWSKEKRRSYQRLFWAATKQYLVFGDVDSSAAYFLRLFELSTITVLDLPFWRSIARAHIPMEYQNDPSRLPDWTQARTDIFRLLDTVSTLASTSPNLRKLYPKIRSSAFLGLADEAVRNFEFRRAYGWLWIAAQFSPRILISRPYWGTIWRSLSFTVHQRLKIIKGALSWKASLADEAD